MGASLLALAKSIYYDIRVLMSLLCLFLTFDTFNNYVKITVTQPVVNMSKNKPLLLPV